MEGTWTLGDNFFLQPMKERKSSANPAYACVYILYLVVIAIVLKTGSLDTRKLYHTGWEKKLEEEIITFGEGCGQSRRPSGCCF